MDFSFTEEQEMLRGQVRAFLDKEFSEPRVIELAESGSRRAEVGWKGISDLGLTGLSASEEAGGSGMSFLDEVVILEEMGYGLYPGPYASTVLLAQIALEGAPELLAAVVGGERTATLAWAEEGIPAGLGRSVPGTKATDDGGWKLSGTKRLVPDADQADLFVVTAVSDGETGLWAVEAADVEVTALPTMDTTRRYGALELSGSPATLLASGERATEVLERTRLRALAGYAVEAVGVAQKALDLAQAYAKEREQFGKGIGSYQAVSHQVADTYMGVELARSLAYWAAWAVAESDPQAEVASASAKSFAAEAAVAACERAIQVHGGIGFTWEHVLHRYYKRAQWLEAFDGFGRLHRAAVAAELLTT